MGAFPPSHSACVAARSLCCCARKEKSTSSFSYIQYVCEDCKSGLLAGTDFGTEFPKWSGRYQSAALAHLLCIVAFATHSGRNERSNRHQAKRNEGGDR